jgi:hypothetical protein
MSSENLPSFEDTGLFAKGLSRIRRPFSGKASYQQLETTGRKTSSLTKTLLAMILFSSAIWGTVSIGFQLRGLIQSSQTISCDCGSSTAEARAMGCKYDTMSAAWLPDICRDDGLSAEFDLTGDGPDGKWQYWADRAQKRLLSMQELSELADTHGVFYTTWAWHIRHCTFRWKKQLSSGFQRAKMNEVDAVAHIEHCDRVIFSDPTVIVASYIGLNGSSYS